MMFRDALALTAASLALACSPDAGSDGDGASDLSPLPPPGAPAEIDWELTDPGIEPEAFLESEAEQKRELEALVTDSLSDVEVEIEPDWKFLENLEDDTGESQETREAKARVP